MASDFTDANRVCVCARLQGSKAPGSVPAELGVSAAAVGLFAFVWMELASPDSASLPWIKSWLAIYAVAVLGGAFLCGPTWFARADPFEVYSMVASRLSPFRRRRDTGDIVIGNPLDHLPSLPVRPGVVAVVAVLFGSTAFDGFQASTDWRNFADTLSRAMHSVPVAGVIVGDPHRRTADLYQRRCSDVHPRRTCHRRSQRRPATRSALRRTHPDRDRLHLRPLPVVSGRARSTDFHRAGRPTWPGLEHFRGSGICKSTSCFHYTPPCWRSSRCCAW